MEGSKLQCLRQSLDVSEDTSHKPSGGHSSRTRKEEQVRNADGVLDSGLRCMYMYYSIQRFWHQLANTVLYAVIVYACTRRSATTGSSAAESLIESTPHRWNKAWPRIWSCIVCATCGRNRCKMASSAHTLRQRQWCVRLFPYWGALGKM